MVIVHIIARKVGERKGMGWRDFPKNGDFFPVERSNRKKRGPGAAVIPPLKGSKEKEVRHNAGKGLSKGRVDNVITKI